MALTRVKGSVWNASDNDFSFFNGSDYGVVGDGVTDDTAAIQAAIDAAEAAGGGNVFLATGTHLISAMLVIDQPMVVLFGPGDGAGYHDVGGNSIVGTGLKWGGAAGGTMMTVAPVSGGVNQRLNGSGVHSIYFDSNLAGDQADFSLIINSTFNAVYEDLFFLETGNTALTVGVVANLGEAKDSQHNTFRNISGRVFTGTGTFLKLTGDNTANTSINYWENLSCQHRYGVGIDFGDCDANTFDLVRMTHVSGAGETAITRFADDGGGVVIVTNPLLEAITGQTIYISGTTNYDGVFKVLSTGAGFLKITATFVADDATGTVHTAPSMIFRAGETGVSGSANANNIRYWAGDLVIAEGTEINNIPSSNNSMWFRDDGNGIAEPIIGAGASVYSHGTDGIFADHGLDKVTIGDSNANVDSERDNVTNESLRITNASANHIRITNGTEEYGFAIGSNGNLRFARSAGTGEFETFGDIVLTSGTAGVDYSNHDNAAGMTNQILNHYEEGGWLPLPADAWTGGNTFAPGALKGYYTKIGKLITITWSLTNISTAGMTAGNDFYIQGLPYVPGVDLPAVGSVVVDNVAFGGSLSCYISPGESAIRLVESAGGAQDWVIVSQIVSGGSDIHGSITYRTSL